MLFLRSLFRARNSLQAQRHHDAREMTVLEHLEDLRRTLIRMGLTVMVAMLACFAFTPTLLEWLRLPVEQVWSEHERALLPAGVKVQEWMLAKEVEGVRRELPLPARMELESRFESTTLALADALPLLRAAALLPEREQAAYLAAASANEAQRELALALHESGADLHDGQSRADPQIMGAFQPGEAFMLSLQLAFFGGAILSSPLLLYFMLQFIVPGLLENERRLLYKSIWYGLGLFVLGCAFAYEAALPRVLSFFFEYSWQMGIANDWRIGYYISFAAKLILVFGIIFELPVIVIPLIKLGLLTYARMKKSRPYALVASFGIALLLAPAPDPGTMLIMALPLYFLYELCILFAWREERRAELHAYGNE